MKGYGNFKKKFNLIFFILICLVSVVVGTIIATKMINDELGEEEIQKQKIEQIKEKEEQAKKEKEEQERLEKERAEKSKQTILEMEKEKKEKIELIKGLKELQEKKIKKNKMKNLRDILTYRAQDKKLFYFFIGYSNKKILIVKEGKDVFIIEFQDVDGFDFPLSMRETFKTDINNLNTKNNEDFDIFTAMFLSEKSKSSIYGEQFSTDLELKRIGNVYITNKVNFKYNLNKFIYIPKTLGIDNSGPFLNLFDILKTINDNKENVFMANFDYNELTFLKKWYSYLKEGPISHNFYLVKVNSHKLNNIILSRKLLNNGLTQEEINNNYFLKVLQRYYLKRLSKSLDFYGNYSITKIESFIPYKEVETITFNNEEDEEKLNKEIKEKRERLDNLLSNIIRIVPENDLN